MTPRRCGSALPLLDLEEDILENPNQTTCGALECPSDFEMINSAIWNNTAKDDGAGVYMRLGAATFENTVFYGNEAPDQGAAIAVKQDGHVELVNTIVSGSDGSPAIFLINESQDGSYTSSLSIEYSDIWGNDDGDFSGFENPAGTNGNISEDPLFTDPDEGDFTLQEGSPAIDSGTGQDSDGTPADMGVHGGPDAP